MRPKIKFKTDISNILVIKNPKKLAKKNKNVIVDATRNRFNNTVQQLILRFLIIIRL